MTADQTLQAHGLTGDRLLRLARRIANDAQRKAPAGLGGKYEELVSFLYDQALHSAMRYDPAKSKPGYTFSSYLCDIMENRVPDFYRRKSEGFGDSRSGNNDRIILAGDTIDEHSSPDPATLETTDGQHTHWADAARALSTPMRDWAAVNERAAMQWIRAAELSPYGFEGWVRRTLDIAARHQLSSDQQAA